MKTGMELVKEMRAQSDKDEATETVYNQSRSDGYAGAADLLETWLREADKWVESEGCRAGFGWLAQKVIRRDLLGTTQSSGVSGEGK